MTADRSAWNRLQPGQLAPALHPGDLSGVLGQDGRGEGEQRRGERKEGETGSWRAQDFRSVAAAILNAASLKACCQHGSAPTRAVRPYDTPLRRVLRMTLRRKAIHLSHRLSSDAAGCVSKHAGRLSPLPATRRRRTPRRSRPGRRRPRQTGGERAGAVRSWISRLAAAERQQDEVVRRGAAREALGDEARGRLRLDLVGDHRRAVVVGLAAAEAIGVQLPRRRRLARSSRPR